MNKAYRLVFFGTPEISVQILQKLYAMSQIEIISIVSQPNRLRNRKKEVISTPVAHFATDHNIPLWQPAKIVNIYDKLLNLRPDILLTCAYGQILPAAILALPKYKALNIHTSLLPKYRGGAPIARAILNQCSTTGVSIMDMVEKMDAGPFYVQQTLPITQEDTTLSLTTKLGELAADLVSRYILPITTGAILPIKQNEASATYAPNIKPIEARINWNQPAAKIHALVRAMFNNPIAYTKLEDSDIFKIHRTELVKDLYLDVEGNPGDIIAKSKKGLIIRTGEGVIVVNTLQKTGKRPSSAVTFNNLVGKCFI